MGSRLADHCISIGIYPKLPNKTPIKMNLQFQFSYFNLLLFCQFFSFANFSPLSLHRSPPFQKRSFKAGPTFGFFKFLFKLKFQTNENELRQNPCGFHQCQYLVIGNARPQVHSWVNKIAFFIASSLRRW